MVDWVLFTVCVVRLGVDSGGQVETQVVLVVSRIVFALYSWPMGWVGYEWPRVGDKGTR